MELLTRIQHLSKEKGLLLNTRKTKIMVVDKNRTDDHKVILNGEELEEVKSCVYLGSLINTEVRCMPEVNRRLCIRVLHGPGLCPRAGPARSPWAGPGRARLQ